MDLQSIMKGRSEVCVLFFTALTAPMVAIDTPSLTTAGEVLILICRVTVVEGLTVQPDVVWLDFEGDPVMSGVNHVTVGIVMRNDTESILGLQFSPLHTSHGGQYTCRATINIPSIGSLWISVAAPVIMSQFKVSIVYRVFLCMVAS